METKTGRRIMSKGEYAKAKGKRAGLGITGYCSLLLALVCLGLTISYLCELLFALPGLGMDRKDGQFFYHITLLILISGAATFLFGKLGIIGFRQAGEVKTGVPLTRHTAAHLPAPDSLVRASEQPLQAQEAVLLRAAAQGQETPPEQLVRASVGQE